MTSIAIVGSGVSGLHLGLFLQQHGAAILEDMALDEQFCRRVAREREAFVLGVSDWTNMILNPEPHVVGLLLAMAQSKPLCDAYTQNFNHPDRQWDAVATPERTAAFIARHAAGQPAQVVIASR